MRRLLFFFLRRRCMSCPLSRPKAFSMYAGGMPLMRGGWYRMPGRVTPPTGTDTKYPNSHFEWMVPTTVCPIWYRGSTARHKEQQNHKGHPDGIVLWATVCKGQGPSLDQQRDWKVRSITVDWDAQEIQAPETHTCCICALPTVPVLLLLLPLWEDGHICKHGESQGPFAPPSFERGCRSIQALEGHDTGAHHMGVKSTMPASGCVEHVTHLVGAQGGRCCAGSRPAQSGAAG